MKSKKPSKPSVEKEDFIYFLSHSTPQELNQLILEKGKPHKPYCPISFSRKTEIQEEK